MTHIAVHDRFEAMEFRLGRRGDYFRCYPSCRKSSNLIDTKLRKRVLFAFRVYWYESVRLLESTAIAAIQSGADVLEFGS